jgi:ERCC4-related helicase
MLKQLTSVLIDGLIVNTGVGTTTISNTLHEDRVNEQKRKLKILAPALMFQVLSMYRKL